MSRELREKLPERFPGSTFSFLPADIISQILNFGAPAPIDVQVAAPTRRRPSSTPTGCCASIRAGPGHGRRAHAAVAQLARHARRCRPHAGAVCRPHRARRHQSLVVNLAGTGQIAPTFWLNPKNGVSYKIVMQTPQYRLDSLASLRTCRSRRRRPARCRCWAASPIIRRDTASAVVSQYDLQPLVQIYAATQDRDLGAVAADVRRIIDELAPSASPKSRAVDLRGQVGTMNTAFSGLLFGLLGAIVLIYLLIVVNFQSWIDPFVIITALPAALAGIVWMLFATGTTLSVPALTGAIMCMGVATANSILVVSFARERLAEQGDAARRRSRPASRASARC